MSATRKSCGLEDVLQEVRRVREEARRRSRAEAEKLPQGTASAVWKAAEEARGLSMLLTGHLTGLASGAAKAVRSAPRHKAHIGTNMDMNKDMRTVDALKALCKT
eukprot:Hpha_TRINITY_DN16899_c2_g1::TRINITY_DN16899_c2_g1_i2::g.148683::m.148683